MIDVYRHAHVRVLAVEYDPFKYCGKVITYVASVNPEHGGFLTLFAKKCNLPYAHSGVCEYIIPSSPYCDHPWACYDQSCNWIPPYLTDPDYKDSPKVAAWRKEFELYALRGKGIRRRISR